MLDKRVERVPEGAAPDELERRAAHPAEHVDRAVGRRVELGVDPCAELALRG